MNRDQYELFLLAGAWACAVGALLNLARLKKRGASALLLASAFLLFGGLLWLVKLDVDRRYITGVAILVAGLLVSDVVVRSRNQGGDNR